MAKEYFEYVIAQVETKTEFCPEKYGKNTVSNTGNFPWCGDKIWGTFATVFEIKLQMYEYPLLHTDFRQVGVVMQ